MEKRKPPQPTCYTGIGVIGFKGFRVNICSKDNFGSEELSDVHKSHKNIIDMIYDSYFDDLFSEVYKIFCDKYENIPNFDTFQVESLRTNGLDNKSIMVEYYGNNGIFNGCDVTFSIPGYTVSNNKMGFYLNFKCDKNEKVIHHDYEIYLNNQGV